MFNNNNNNYYNPSLRSETTASVDFNNINHTESILNKTAATNPGSVSRLNFLKESASHIQDTSTKSLLQDMMKLIQNIQEQQQTDKNVLYKLENTIEQILYQINPLSNDDLTIKQLITDINNLKEETLSTIEEKENLENEQQEEKQFSVSGLPSLEPPLVRRPSILNSSPHKNKRNNSIEILPTENKIDATTSTDNNNNLGRWKKHRSKGHSPSDEVYQLLPIERQYIQLKHECLYYLYLFATQISKHAKYSWNQIWLTGANDVLKGMITDKLILDWNKSNFSSNLQYFVTGRLITEMDDLICTVNIIKRANLKRPVLLYQLITNEFTRSQSAAYISIQLSNSHSVNANKCVNSRVYQIINEDIQSHLASLVNYKF